ncbi:MAG: hypothetical protein ABJN39_12390 [Sulfitobacter sp.]|uniref:hypothetical protein n=1 Tax=Sulfitobacter sp. TaxID=1903071 RepID=UPI003298366A
MTKIRTTTIDAAPDPCQCYKDLILEALRAKGFVPSSHRSSQYPPYLSLDTLEHFILKNEGTGWSFFLTFETPEVGMPNTLALPPQMRVEDAMSAFLLGAQTICEIATGSCELPFKALGSTLFFATVGPETFAAA